MKLNRNNLRKLILAEMSLNESLMSATENLVNAIQQFIESAIDNGISSPRAVREAVLAEVEGVLEEYEEEYAREGE